ncbi:MAG TPA: stage II sporulation protein M [Candidatus Saccharimonadales bacterium]|nr:stage II sporulation protein M [Candidatus Saccharimonadales bacterium]
MIRAAFAAIGRSRVAILSIAATYAVSIVVGVVMVSSGNGFALDRRDQIVGAAQSSGSLVALRAGEPVRAALLDFASNLVLGGITSTILGIAVVGVYPIVAYRGWVGGIVSVDSRHQSRLGDPARAGYYLLTLLVQLIPYSIAGGIGVRLGVGAWRAVKTPRPDTWLGLPTDALRDVAAAYVVIVPLFLVAALWEFLAA